MVDGKSFKQFLAEEKEKTNKMNGKEKLSYFATYYLKGLIAVVLIIIFLIYCIVSFTSANEEPALEGAIVNLSLSEAGQEALTTGVEEFLGDNAGQCQLETDMNITFTLEETDNYSYANRLKLMSQVAAEELDFMILSQDAYENLLKEDMFLDISAYTDGFDLIDDCAIDLSSYGLDEKLGLEGTGNVYLIFLVNGPHPDNYIAFLEYLQSLED